ncbi:probable RNA-directed DNA polymerase from transposon BS [Trichonephila clavipes]|nr:probable RNA-directed DNA polymerase from transposon BS [Trichonephila clavipes]
MILIRIHYFLDSKNLIPGEQYGYRRGHSTVDQIISFCQSIRDAQNCKPTHHTMAALLDLTKAFDRVWKHKLLIKLHDTFNIRGNTLAWISDFLHHRSMRVNFNNTFSDPVVLGQGVPQGSVLSPTLFSLYLAGIEKIPSVEMRVGLFADDIVIWCSGRDLVEMERNLNNALSSFSDYALEFKLCFNPTKSITTFFTTNKRLYSYQPNLKMDNKNLAYEKHPKYLGYVLDPEWSSHKHIDHIVSKCRKRLSILKFIAGKDWGADAVTLRDTFLALIRPILEYGFPVYCCASAASLEKLEKIQLGAARIITGLRRSCPKEIVLFEADLQPLHLRSKNILTNYFNKLSSYGHHNKTSLYFNNWHNNQRLKRNSPFSYADHLQLPSSHIEPHSLKSCLSPSEGLPRVHFHFNMSAPVTKQDLIPAHLRQLALESINEIPCDAIKIYTDGSRLDDRAGDKTSISILHNLKLISKHHDVHFQWIPSHVDIFGNEQADRLAREGCSLLTTSSPAITYSEHQSKVNRQLSKEWKIPPSHHWYAAREPGSFLDLNCDRASKTAISRLASGHTKSLSFFEGRKTFKFCSKCKVQQASAEHILDCLGLSREDLYDSPLLVIDFLRQINFECYSQQFKDSHVNGDLLFQLDEDNLKKDIGMVNGIHRKKFLEELKQLKICSDYSSCDPSGLNNFLQKLDNTYSQYTYTMLLNGINLENISALNKDFLEKCGVINSFHKERIWAMIKAHTEGGSKLLKKKCHVLLPILGGDFDKGEGLRLVQLKSELNLDFVSGRALERLGMVSGVARYPKALVQRKKTEGPILV